MKTGQPCFESATRPGPNPASGPSSSGKDAETSSAPPPKAMPPVLRQRQKGQKGRQPVLEGLRANLLRQTREREGVSLNGFDDSAQGSFRLRGMCDFFYSQSGHHAFRDSPCDTAIRTASATSGASAPQTKTASEAESVVAPTTFKASPSQPKAKSGVEKASSVAGAPSGRSSQASGAAETGYPTIAESLGQKKGPPKKAAPSSRTTSAQPPMANLDTKGAATSGAMSTAS